MFNWYCVPRIPNGDWDDLSYNPYSTFETGIVNGGERDLYGLKKMVKYELANALPRGGISAPKRSLGPDYMHHFTVREFTEGLQLILLISLNTVVGCCRKQICSARSSQSVCWFFAASLVQLEHGAPSSHCIECQC